MIKFCAYWYEAELAALASDPRDAWDNIGVSHPDSIARIGGWCCGTWYLEDAEEGEEILALGRGVFRLLK